MHHHRPEHLLGLLQRRPFQKKFVKTISLAHEIALHPNGERYLSAAQVYSVTGRPNDNTGYHEVLSTVLRRIHGGAGATLYGINDERLQRWVGIASQQGLKVFTLKEVAANQGWCFNEPIPRAEMTIKGDRCYAWWVPMRKSIRQRLFLETHPVMYDYDIQASKATLLLQAYDKALAYSPHRRRMAAAVPTWRALVEDRRSFRERFALEIGASPAQVKEVLNVMLQGGHASAGGGSLREIVHVPTLLKSKIYQDLRGDFSFAWQFVFKQHAPLGKTQGEFMTRYYNALENRVMSAIQNDVSAWYVHDGFFSNREWDSDYIEGLILERTGFNVKLECATHIP